MACATAVTTVCPTGPAQVLAEWEDLESVGHSRSSFRDKYREIYSVEPDCVSINEGICMEYGHLCYTSQETATYSNRHFSTVIVTGDTKELVNTTDKPVTLQVELKSTHKTFATVVVTEPSAFSVGKKLSVSTRELGIHSMFSVSFSLDNHAGSNYSTSEDVEVADYISLTLEPGQRAKARLDVSWMEMKEDFTVPFSIDGWVMATFPHLVNGQRYWLHDLASLFDTPKSLLKGTVECVFDIKGSTQVQFL